MQITIGTRTINVSTYTIKAEGDTEKIGFEFECNNKKSQFEHLEKAGLCLMGVVLQQLFTDKK